MRDHPWLGEICHGRSPVASCLRELSSPVFCAWLSHISSEAESAREDRAFHVDVEAQIAVACLIVKIEAAITQMNVDPRVERIVDRADELPVDMRADPEAADIAIGRSAEPVAKVVVIATADQRIAPARAAVDALAGEEAGVEREIGGEAPSAKAEAQIGELGRLVD